MHVGSSGGGGCGGGSGTGGPGAGLHLRASRAPRPAPPRAHPNPRPAHWFGRGRRERMGGVVRRLSWRELENYPCRPEPVTRRSARLPPAVHVGLLGPGSQLPSRCAPRVSRTRSLAALQPHTSPVASPRSTLGLTARAEAGRLRSGDQPRQPRLAAS
ncbi:hypothetical protein J1605_005294 [Eschrichtius robustus]|uniref:Uncharacterized protein n=1 Tax=Eschrichtius robustus TaxID=9764 RepID=A0AB34HBA1_ESCRO|nr:hypothetical protein J1605_005294 [Eschrichtius robustus]